MLSQHFYHRTIRKITAAFGSLFTEMKICRYNNAGVIVNTIEVPISYAPAAKNMIRRIEENSLSDSVEGKTSVKMILPRMSYELSGLSYDANRALNKIKKMVSCDGNGKPTAYQYTKVPYNLNYTLSILANKTEDCLQIAEQIIPYFSPSFTIPLLLNDMTPTIPEDLPIILEDVSFQDNYDSDFTEQREIIWTLSFTIQAWFYFPTITDMAGLIEKININYEPYDRSTIWETTTIQARKYNIFPVENTLNIGQTVKVDWVDASKVITCQWSLISEDVGGIYLKHFCNILATHNGTDVFFTVYGTMGDGNISQIPIDVQINNGELQLIITNLAGGTQQIKTIRFDIEK